MPFIPHTEADTQEMLAVIGVDNTDALFDEVPASLRLEKLDNVPGGMTEMALAKHMKQLASKDAHNHCFIGAGAYEHYIPAAVWDIVSRGEFMTAYTPYQAEASQGTLQTIYEYQTMMASLTGMDVSNASLYDGASAVAEAVLMAVRCHRKSKKILVPQSLHPTYRNVMDTVVKNQGIELVSCHYTEGVTTTATLAECAGDNFAAIIIQQPNFFGCLEEVDELVNWAHEKGAMVIAVVNPMALALLRPPGLWGKDGADIACGEGQPLGVPLASGGPYFGFLCCKKPYVRQLPGRVIGRTVDMDGKPGFALTLQAREQHIRRSKATSNICTNQGLLMTAATIYMSLMGPNGLSQVASSSANMAHLLVDELTTIAGVSQHFQQPFFHEGVLQLEKPVEQVLEKLAEQNILGGFSLKHDYPELGDALLVCATETKTPEDIEAYKTCLQQIMAA